MDWTNLGAVRAFAQKMAGINSSATVLKMPTRPNYNIGIGGLYHIWKDIKQGYEVIEVFDTRKSYFVIQTEGGYVLADGTLGKPSADNPAREWPQGGAKIYCANIAKPELFPIWIVELDVKTNKSINCIPIAEKPA